MRVVIIRAFCGRVGDDGLEFKRCMSMLYLGVVNDEIMINWLLNTGYCVWMELGIGGA